MQLSTEDKERIEQEAEKLADSKERRGTSHWIGLDIGYRAGAEYATIYERQKQAELKSIADILATIVDTPEFGKMWPGTAHSLRTKLKSLKTK